MIEPSDTERSELPDCTFFYLLKLEEENAKLREALKFYANPENYDYEGGGGIARAALEGEQDV